jgi:hypothetical protein
MPEPMYIVFNKTDEVYASPDTMTRAEAEAFVKGFRERFRAQGYYKSCAGRIPVDSLELEIQEA